MKLLKLKETEVKALEENDAKQKGVFEKQISVLRHQIDEFAVYRGPFCCLLSFLMRFRVRRLHFNKRKNRLSPNARWQAKSFKKLDLASQSLR